MLTQQTTKDDDCLRKIRTLGASSSEIAHEW